MVCSVRFVWAVVAFIIAAVMIGAGIAQRTVFQGPSETSQTVQTDASTAYTLIDGAVLNSMPGSQTLRIEGDGQVFAAYGRTADVQAWLADVEYTAVTVDAEGVAQTSTVEPSVDESTTSEPATEEQAAEEQSAEGSVDAAPAAPARTPVGSDLWLDEFQQEGSLATTLRLPADMSVLVASDGTAPAPSTISLTWPIDDSTPWAGPLIVGGSIALLAGVILYFLGIRHVRRSRRPRRKGLPLPPTEPISIAGADAEKGVISSTPGRRPSRGRGVLGSGRRAFVAVPAVGLSAILLAGCSADAWPQMAASSSPSPTPTVIVPEGQFPPAVTEEQAKRIVARISGAVAEADAAMDPAIAETRLSGPALEERKTNYTLRAALPERPALPALPAEPVQIVLPQTISGWPRTVMTVVESQDAATPTTTIMMMTQDDPWSEYRASYVGNLEASTNLPELAAPYVGATQVPPDSSFLVLPPDEVASAYADLINNGENSTYWDRFDTAGDLLLPAIAENKRVRTEEFAQTAEGTGELSFTASAGPAEPIALATLDTGAIVAVNVYESDTAKSTNSDAVIKLDNNPAVKALTGVDQSATGFTTTYSDQIFFYVPSQGSDEQIRLLGYRSSLLEAKVSP